MREPTTVTALNGMEKAGLVRRVPSKDDRRKIHVALTPRARKLQHKLMPFVAEVNAIASQGIAADDIAVLRRVLIRMNENLAREEENFLKTHAGAKLPLGAASP
jgi:DNA-binding MarR family transcriptional regulator